jgi:hypothetical protein
METQPMPEFIISPMRVQMLPEINFFYIAGSPMPLNELDKDFDAMLDSLETAKAQAHLDRPGPDIVRYYKVDASEPGLFQMEVGILVKPGTQPAGSGRVKTLTPIHCAGVLFWGSLVHIRAAYESLHKAIQEAGLVPTGENQEWTYYFENSESPRNLMGIYIGVKEKN